MLAFFEVIAGAINRLGLLPRMLAFFAQLKKVIAGAIMIKFNELGLLPRMLTLFAQL